MEDLIKRSDAIKAVWGDDINPSEDGMVFEAQSHIDRDIRLIPSADRPQGEWILCSERLPTKAGHYLCSFKKPRCVDNIYVDLAYWTGGRWYGYLAPEIKAWMPLPKPWEGADDERKDIQSTDE